MYRYHYQARQLIMPGKTQGDDPLQKLLYHRGGVQESEVVDIENEQCACTIHLRHKMCNINIRHRYVIHVIIKSLMTKL